MTFLFVCFLCTHTDTHTHAYRARRTSHTSYAQYADKWLFLSVSVVYYRIYRMLLFSLLVLSDIFTIFNHLAMQNNWQAFFHLFIFAANNINNKIVDCQDTKKEREGEIMRSYAACLFAHDLLGTSTQCWQYSRLICKTAKFKLSFPWGFSSVSQRIFTRSIKLPPSPQLALLCQIKF